MFSGKIYVPDHLPGPEVCPSIEFRQLGLRERKGATLLQVTAVENHEPLPFVFAATTALESGQGPRPHEVFYTTAAYHSLVGRLSSVVDLHARRFRSCFPGTKLQPISDPALDHLGQIRSPSDARAGVSSRGTQGAQSKMFDATTR